MTRNICYEQTVGHLNTGRQSRLPVTRLRVEKMQKKYAGRDQLKLLQFYSKT